MRGVIRSLDDREGSVKSHRVPEYTFRQFVIKNSILNGLKLLIEKNPTSIVKKGLKIS